MAQLAIKGHATRGREVIELLEMLGGINKKYRINFTEENLLYTIREGDDAIIATYPNTSINKIFTLEEFLEKFPYKVGDKVLVKGMPKTIKGMNWNYDSNEMLYKVETNVRGFTEEYHVFAYDLQPYKEETMEGKGIPPYMDYDIRTEETMEGELISKEEMPLRIDTSQMEKRQIIFSADAPDETELVLGDNYEIKVEGGKTYVVRKKPQYPKTYEECLKILGYNQSHTIPMNHGHNGSLMMKFQRLLICRDAYWKIAGEQMGLGKPWKPELNSKKHKFALSNVGGNISFEVYGEYNSILCFPTEEMRDAFYKNFKDLIEECKELL